MQITIVCVGKVKEAFYRAAVEEYRKRLSRYCKTEIVEVPDEMTKDGAGEAMDDLSRIRPDAFVITLEITGKKMDSIQFAKVLQKACVEGKSHIQFIIGGSLGLHDSVSRRADLKLSFSDMTFPHQLMRVILCEQIYRGYRIINGCPYHK